MISQKALDLIKHHEGVKLKPYRCPAALHTIGVGHVLYPEQAKLPMEDRLKYPIRSEDNRIFTAEEVNEILIKEMSAYI